MTIESLHLISTYLLLCLGTTTLWLAEPPETPPYPAVVILCATAAFFFTDRRPLIRLSGMVSNALGLVIVLTIAQELRGEGEVVLKSLSHFLIYLQVVKCFREKTYTDFGLLYLINMLQVAIGCVLTRTLAFGAALLAYLLAMMVTLTLWNLRRHAEWVHRSRSRSRWSVAGYGGPAVARVVLALQGLLLWLLTIPMSVALFAVIPRLVPPTISSLSTQSSSSRLMTGFSENVRLDEFAPVLQSDDLVLNVRAIDGWGHSASLPDGLLWRGMVFTQYQNRAWNATPPYELQGSVRTWPASPPSVGGSVIRFYIDQETPTDNTVISPNGLIWAKCNHTDYVAAYAAPDDRVKLLGRRRAHEPRRRTLSFLMFAEKDSGTNDVKASRETTQTYLTLATSMPPGFERLRELGATLTKELSADDVAGRIRKVEAYLSDPKQFQYTLDLQRSDASIDPVEDFLFNTRKGHCEYFASAAALLLRSLGIPARVVNGFKGAEWNELAGVYQIRQRMAHSWVEAYVDGYWRTVDPSPVLRDADSGDEQLSWQERISRWATEGTRIWLAYVIGYSETDQSRLIGQPLSHLASQVLDDAADLLSGRESVWGGDVSPASIAVATASLAALSLFLWRIRRARGASTLLPFLQWFRRRSADAPGRFTPYEAWTKALRKIHWTRRPSQTPREFALEVAELMRTDDRLRPWSDLPTAVADRLYEFRFGGRQIDESIQRPLAERIRVFRDLLPALGEVLDHSRRRSLHPEKPKASLSPSRIP